MIDDDSFFYHIVLILVHIISRSINSLTHTAKLRVGVAVLLLSPYQTYWYH